MKISEQIVQSTRRPQRGGFATLSGLFTGKGIGALSPRRMGEGSGASSLGLGEGTGAPSGPDTAEAYLPVGARLEPSSDNPFRKPLASLRYGDGGLAGATRLGGLGGATDLRAPSHRLAALADTLFRRALSSAKRAPAGASSGGRALIFSTAALAMTLACIGGLAAASPAQAQQPWWRLTSLARPTYLHPEAGAKAPGQDEVQEVVAYPSRFHKGIAFGVRVGSGTTSWFGTEYFLEPLYEGFFTEATAANIQKALEGPEAYGKGNVTVKEEPPIANELRFAITTVRAKADQAVTSIEAEGEEGSSAQAKVITEGKAAQSDATVVASVINMGNVPTSEPCVKVPPLAGSFTSESCEGEPAPGTGEYEKQPVRIVDRLPAGVEAVGVEGVREEEKAGKGELLECFLESKAGEGPLVVCSLAEKKVLPFDLVEVRVAVLVKGEAPASSVNENEINEISVSGGGAPPASIRRALKLSSEPTPFGVEDYEATPEEEGGKVDTQAGSHPFQTTFTLDVNQTKESVGVSGKVQGNPVALVRDIKDNLPPGLIGNPVPLARCTLTQFLALVNECPAASVVGVAVVTINEPVSLGIATWTEPVFNLEPTAGEPAKLGFQVDGRENPVYINPSVRAGSDYGITATVPQITQTIATMSSVVTFWGVPGESSHDSTRGNKCLEIAEKESSAPCLPLDEASPPAFFELPTSCTGPLQSSLEVDSWAAPGNFATGENVVHAHTGEEGDAAMPALDGCNRLPFEPSLEVKPDVPDASTATGLTVNVKVPQEESETAHGLGEADIRDTTVTLPAGVDINPAGGEGLEACSNGLVGYEERFSEPELQPGVSVPRFKSYIPGDVAAKTLAAAHEIPEAEGTFSPGLNFCANASKIGTVRIKLPVIKKELEGAVYLADQESNPFGSLIAMYIVAEDKESGVLVKLPGHVELGNGADGLALGQIKTTFENTPQAPAEEIELHFFGGERAPLATPSRCGSYTTTTAFTPWSAAEPASAAEIAGPSATFGIEHGPNGGPCPGAQLPFNPTVTGGATNLQAGEFTPLTVSVSRSDGEQNIKSIVAKLPPGLSGVLTGVELCPEPQANLGECGPNSLIGEATVSVGVGGHPYTVHGGKFYLTGPYNGTGACTVAGGGGTLPGGTSSSTQSSNGCAPFGLTFEVPAKAGPYDLANTKSNKPPCDCVIVRGKIELNPLTSAITITSNPAGTADSIPTQLEGIPLEIQHINATTTRSDFQFNPTNCSKMALEGIVELSEGGTHTFTEPFQVTNCAALKFEPKFSVSTSGKTSKADGASLTAKVTYPNVPRGTDANITKVKVELPVQLPSRLTTLQKACTDAQFEANPAACPSASKIGYAVVHTPLIPVPLEGPAIFVSHGGEAFPSLTMVLQGYGITIDLVGTTFISKSGITSTTFKTVPDQPFTSFQLTLPEGKYSALAANGNLCGQKLTMPTELVAQNGAEIKQNTQIAVTGCPNSISISSHKVKGKTTTIQVSVPAAGKLTATGKGLSKASKTASGRETVSLVLNQKKGGKLKTNIKLTFTPSKGAKQTKTVTVRFKK